MNGKTRRDIRMKICKECPITDARMRYCYECNRIKLGNIEIE